MTLALLALAAVLVAFLAYRLVKLPGALGRATGMTQTPLRLVDGGLPSTGHMVFSGPIEKNDHGFITTPMVACVDPKCPCRSFYAKRQ